MPAAVLRTTLLVLSLGSTLAAHAADKPMMLLYRYIDNRGITVLDRQGVPPEYIGKGYQVLNERGRVVQTVPPAPTAEEIQRQQAVQQQADANAQLLQRYTSLADLDRAKARKQAELDAMITSSRNNLQAMLAQQADLQSQAAAQERAGKVVSADLLSQLDSLRDQQARFNAEISRYQAAKVQADQDFNADRVRLEALLN